ACAYSDHEKEWRSWGVEVIAISGDSPENLNLFKKAENLNLTLLSDPQGKIAKTFGVPTGKGGQIERVVNGEKVTLKRGVTAKRWTFVVSKQGKILFVNDRVNAAQDSSSLLSLFKEKNLK
ncbi:MAG: redoxin domain-containing protein, partial [Verrucomicrobiota bacterium]|nr:redoxin domain-containing protein [Verrucomicrobiota bacterium]